MFGGDPHHLLLLTISARLAVVTGSCFDVVVDWDFSWLIMNSPKGFDCCDIYIQRILKKKKNERDRAKMEKGTIHC
jgi:hypothetical protein